MPELLFTGYERPDGSVGVRNHVAVVPTVGCSNAVVRKIVELLGGRVVPLYHGQGCCTAPPDIELTEKVITNLCLNPNAAAVLLVSMGCEGVRADRVADAVAASGKPVELVVIQELGGARAAVEKGVEAAKKLLEEASRARRVVAGLDQLVVGVKCGASDATSGIAANPACGAAVDRVVDAGGTVIFGETTEVIGAEHVLARRAVSKEVAEEILRKVREMEERIRAVGVDVRGGQPTPGNIRGGITTLEEKSLGAVVKSGTRPIAGVLDYGERPPRRGGLYFMDSPGREPEFLTGVAAAGAQVVLFTTGRGAIQGFPLCPVVKICGNPETCARLAEHVDVDVTGIIRGETTVEREGERILRYLLEVASGRPTKAEEHGLVDDAQIYIRGPVI